MAKMSRLDVSLTTLQPAHGPKVPDGSTTFPREWL